MVDWVHIGIVIRKVPQCSVKEGPNVQLKRQTVGSVEEGSNVQLNI